MRTPSVSSGATFNTDHATRNKRAKLFLSVWCAFLLTAFALQAQTTISTGQAYEIVGNGSGLVAQATPVNITLAASSGSNQPWQLIPVDGQHYQILSASGKVLDVYGAGTAPGATVDIAPVVPGATNQEWQLVQLPYFQIVSRATGMVLDVYAAETSNGAPVDIAPAVPGASNQQWKLVSLGDGSYQIVGNRSGRILDVYGADTDPGTPVDIADEVPGASNQAWQLVAIDGQYYQIVSAASGEVLDVYGAGAAPGTIVDIAGAVPGAANQEWQLVELPYFQIVSRATGMVLDVYAAQTSEGAPVDIAPMVPGASNQEWLFLPAGAASPPLLTITGRVTSGTSGVSGVSIALSGTQSASTTTDINGNYSFSVSAGGIYAVAPSASGYSFAPTSRSFTDIGNNQAAADFSELAGSTVTITGNISEPGGSALGVIVTLSGASSGSTVTDANGNYSFTVLAGLSYTVTPSQGSGVFAPGSLSFSSIGGNQTGNFSANPAIASVLPPAGAVNSSVTITGAHFGATRGSSTVTFNGTTATPISWSSAAIVVSVPEGATSGPVVVTAGGVPSNGAGFTVDPKITALSLPSGPPQVGFVITGTSFGATGPGGSSVTLNSAALNIISWTDTSITVQVPAGTALGPGTVVVNVAGHPSNGFPFRVDPAFGCGN